MRTRIDNLLAQAYPGERGKSLGAVVGELTSLLRGWAEYFRPGLRETLVKALGHWIRRRLRAYLWTRWSRPEGDGPQRSLRQRSGAKWQPSALPDDWFTRSAGVVLLVSFCQ